MFICALGRFQPRKRRSASRTAPDHAGQHTSSALASKGSGIGANFRPSTTEAYDEAVQSTKEALNQQGFGGVAAGPVLDCGPHRGAKNDFGTRGMRRQSQLSAGKAKDFRFCCIL